MVDHLKIVIPPSSFGAKRLTSELYHSHGLLSIKGILGFEKGTTFIRMGKTAPLTEMSDLSKKLHSSEKHSAFLRYVLFERLVQCFPFLLEVPN